MTQKHVEVAIGVVFERSAERVLICRRKHDTVLGGYWEFPGGKCDVGEAPEACVRREIMEEVGLTVIAIKALPLIEHVYPYASVRLHPFVCRHVSGEPQLLAVADAKWVLPAELGGYEFPPANAGLLAQVELGWEGLMGNDAAT